MHRHSLVLIWSFALLTGCGENERLKAAKKAKQAEDNAANTVVQQFGGKVKRTETIINKPVTEVDLRHGNVSDSDLKTLFDMKKLENLYLGYTPVTDAGLKELVALKKLISLDIGATHLSDAGLKEVANLKQLKMLYLGSTPVTDSGVMELARLNELTYLDIENTRVTAAGVAELQKAMPKCKINYKAK